MTPRCHAVSHQEMMAQPIPYAYEGCFCDSCDAHRKRAAAIAKDTFAVNPLVHKRIKSALGATAARYEFTPPDGAEWEEPTYAELQARCDRLEKTCGEQRRARRKLEEINAALEYENIGMQRRCKDVQAELDDARGHSWKQDYDRWQREVVTRIPVQTRVPSDNVIASGMAMKEFQDAFPRRGWDGKLAIGVDHGTNPTTLTICGIPVRIDPEMPQRYGMLGTTMFVFDDELATGTVTERERAGWKLQAEQLKLDMDRANEVRGAPVFGPSPCSCGGRDGFGVPHGRLCLRHPQTDPPTDRFYGIDRSVAPPIARTLPPKVTIEALREASARIAADAASRAVTAREYTPGCYVCGACDIPMVGPLCSACAMGERNRVTKARPDELMTDGNVATAPGIAPKRRVRYQTMVVRYSEED